MKKIVNLWPFRAAALAIVARRRLHGADAVDMSTITCGQLMAMPRRRRQLHADLGAGLSSPEPMRSSACDPDALGKSIDAMVAYCKENVRK